jgi:uncharacterized protein
MRAVLDTNVLARAARPGSFAATVLTELISGPHLLILSPWVLSEVARVLRYPRVLAMHGLDDQAIDAFVLQLQTAALVVDPAPTDIIPVVKSDPDDDHLIATAVVGKAEVICTRDKHFNDPAVRSYCQNQSIRILTDADLLLQLRAASSGQSGTP